MHDVMVNCWLLAQALVKCALWTGLGPAIVLGIIAERFRWPEKLYLYRWNRMNRKGQLCRVLVRGKRNSALIEFADGHKAVTSRNALCRVKEGATIR